MSLLMRMGSATPVSCSDLGSEPLSRAGQTLPKLDLWFPSELGARQRDVGAALRGIVLGQRLEHDLRGAVGELEHEVRQLPDGEFVGITDVDRADDVGVEQCEKPLISSST